MKSGKVLSCFFFITLTIIGLLIYIREKSKISEPVSWYKIGVSCSGVLFIIIFILCIPNEISYANYNDNIDLL